MKVPAGGDDSPSSSVPQHLLNARYPSPSNSSGLCGGRRELVQPNPIPLEPVVDSRSGMPFKDYATVEATWPKNILKAKHEISGSRQPSACVWTAVTLGGTQTVRGMMATEKRATP
jgi:hypothetical protein